MTPDDSLLKQLLETFSIELEEFLLLITQHLKKIERGESLIDLSQGMEEISRAGRNIKVSALAIGIADLGEMAEYIEKLFQPKQKISLEIITLVFHALEAMRQLLHNFIEKKPRSAELNVLLHQLEQALFQEKKTTNLVQQEELSTPKSLDDEFIKKIVETFNAELQENLITITDDLLRLEKGTLSPQKSQNTLEEIFRVVHNIKGSSQSVGATHVGDIAHHFETLFTALQKNNLKITPKLINLCLQSIDYMNEAMQCYREDKPLSFDLNAHLMQMNQYAELPVSTSPQIEALSPESPKDSFIEEQPTKTNEFESIRVSLQNLDRISIYTEEIQAIKIVIEEYYAQLTKMNSKIDYVVQSWKKIKEWDKKDPLSTLFSKSIEELAEIDNSLACMQRELRMPINELTHLLNALQDEIRTLRLIPITSQLRYLPRIVRDLAQELNKQVHFEINCDGVKIDKMIFDGLKDPLVHLLRNAIDHGIENTDARKAAGKSPQGNISINVNQEDNQIVFKIIDDGHGIATEDLIRTALQKKLLTPNELEHMNKEDIYELIFRPGFSTREIATDISGRGVGLDAVRSNLLRLKGIVSVQSEPGKGTVFFLKVPLTLATERGLIISCSNQNFVLLTKSVESVLLLKKQDILTVDGQPAILVNEQPVLLCSLPQLLYLNENKLHKENFVSVIVNSNGKRIALLVDEIIDEREIIMKPLQEPITNIPWIIGATLTSSNQINFVLNASEIIKKAGSTGIAAEG